MHINTGEIALCVHIVSIHRVYPCGQPVPESHHCREFLGTFWRSKRYNGYEKIYILIIWQERFS